MLAPPRILAALVPLLLAVSACAGEAGGGGSTAPQIEAQEEDPSVEDDDTETGQAPASPSPAEEHEEPLTDESPPVLSKRSPPAPGYELPPDRAGDLRFWEIRVYGRAGTLTVHANVTNESEEYLNGVTFFWRAFDGPAPVDRGTGSWPALAPGETVSVDLPGSVEFTDGIDRVDFS